MSEAEKAQLPEAAPMAEEPGESAPLPPIPEEAQEQITSRLTEPKSAGGLPPIPEGLEDPDGLKGTPYIFPGFQDTPFRGHKIPDLKKDDREQPQIGLEAHAYVFDLSNPRHVEYYEKIFNLAYNGRAKVGIDQVNFDPRTGKYTAFVRWAFLYSYMKKKQGELSRG